MTARTRTTRRTSARKPSRHLRVDVEWADITRAQGDAFIVGHYAGVQPQNAELALDRALSASDEPSRLLLTDLTRRGAIRGALGDITFFPWTDGRQIVLAGMGRPGTFGLPQLRLLARRILETAGRLLAGRTICTVLIGSGAGNLPIKEAVEGLVDGATAAMADDPSLRPGRLRIVERQLDRAWEILETLKEAAPRLERSRRVGIAVRRDVVEREAGGSLAAIPAGLSLMLARMARAYQEGRADPLHVSVEALVRELPAAQQRAVRSALQRLGREPQPRRLAFAVDVDRSSVPRPAGIADRVSFTHDGTHVRTAAITNTTTVTERQLDIPLQWVDRIVEELAAARPEDVEARAISAYRRLVPRALAEQLEPSERPLVVEVDRTMARVAWEMLQEAEARVPLGVRRPVARQLRTSYSPLLPHARSNRTVRALVIGDPDDSLPQARSEARDVAQVLAGRGLGVELRLGAPDGIGKGRDGSRPADLFEIIGLLQTGTFDLVHFAGHAIFDPGSPDRSGWVFKDHVFTPSKLEQVDRPPRMIMANACVSARLAPGPADARLVAGLADEFFRRGVADYIGAAWEIPELPARLFAETFYMMLLGAKTRSRSRQGITLGLAVQHARRVLYERRGDWGAFHTVWAAFQHYGDPTRTLTD